MATDSTSAPPAAAVPPPTIHEAELASGGCGGVVCGDTLTLDGAVARRQAGDNVVVCGDDVDANRRLAEQIESRVGRCRRGEPHKRRAGPQALPHYQQETPPPAGHTFYETSRRKTRKRR